MTGRMVLAARPQAELTLAAAPGAPPVADACCALQCLSRLRPRRWAPRGARSGGPRRFWHLPINALSTRTALRTERTARRQRRRRRSRARGTRPPARARAKTRTRAVLSSTRTQRQARTPLCHNASACLSPYALLVCLVWSVLSANLGEPDLPGVQPEEYPFIKQIKLHNFMCHPRLTVDFIPEVHPSQLLARPPAGPGDCESWLLARAWNDPALLARASDGSAIAWQQINLVRGGRLISSAAKTALVRARSWPRSRSVSGRARLRQSEAIV